MPKKNRLSGTEIRRLVPIKRLNSGLFSLSVSEAKDSGGKIAYVVSKKVSVKATIRNLVKRRMRAALRALPKLPAVHGVLSAKPATASSSYAVIRDDIAALIEKSAGYAK